MKDLTTITRINIDEVARFFRFCAAIDRHLAYTNRRLRLAVRRKTSN